MFDKKNSKNQKIKVEEYINENVIMIANKKLFYTLILQTKMLCKINK